MSASRAGSRPTQQRGLFLFFVVGLFLLQIAFAFTIHGDIGPQYPVPSGMERTAPEALMGQIDSLLTCDPVARPACKPRPEAAPAAASRKIIDATLPVSIMAKPSRPMMEPNQDDPAGRFAEYVIEKGDTLEAIARKLYGSSRMVVHLVRLNRIQDDKGLHRGDRLLVPRAGLKASASPR